MFIKNVGKNPIEKYNCGFGVIVDLASEEVIEIKHPNAAKNLIRLLSPLVKEVPKMPILKGVKLKKISEPILKSVKVKKISKKKTK